MAFRSGNPALRKAVFERNMGTHGEIMTVSGTVNKTMILLSLLFLSAAGTWYYALTGGGFAAISGFMWPSFIAAFVVAIIINLSPKSSPYLTPLYAILEGVALGVLSLFIETLLPGIVLQAVLGTFGVMMTMLVVHKVFTFSDNFKMGISAATGAIVLVYMFTLIFRLFGFHVPFIHSGGWLGIGFSLLVIGIAAFNFILDFDAIQDGEVAELPDYFEWYFSFSLLLTLAWLYVEILHLLSLLTGRE